MRGFLLFLLVCAITGAGVYLSRRGAVGRNDAGVASAPVDPVPNPVVAPPAKPRPEQESERPPEPEPLQGRNVESLKAAVDSRTPLGISVEKDAVGLVARWLREANDAREISDWLDARRDRRDLDQARALLAHRWVMFDPEAVVSWIESLPAGEGRDQCVKVVEWSLLGLKEGGPEMAYRLAKLPDASGVLREDLVRDAVSFMIKADPENAIRLIEEAPLPAEEKALAIALRKKRQKQLLDKRKE